MTSNIIKAEHTNNDILYEKIKALDDKIQKYENNKCFNKLFNFIKFFNTIYNYKFIILNFIILFINIYILYFNKAYSYKIYGSAAPDAQILYNLEEVKQLDNRMGTNEKIVGFCSMLSGQQRNGGWSPGGEWYFIWERK